MARSPSSRQRSGLRGVGKLRRTLRRLDPETTKELREAVEEGAEAMLQDMVQGIPKDTGDTAALLDKRVARDGLTARVGMVTAKAKRDGYVARFIEFGTKGDPKRNIPPQPARPFMTPAFDLNKDWILTRARKGISLALERAARGPDDE